MSCWSASTRRCRLAASQGRGGRKAGISTGGWSKWRRRCAPGRTGALRCRGRALGRKGARQASGGAKPVLAQARVWPARAARAWERVVIGQASRAGARWRAMLGGVFMLRVGVLSAGTCTCGYARFNFRLCFVGGVIYPPRRAA
jgi:hypothetical protein